MKLSEIGMSAHTLPFDARVIAALHLPDPVSEPGRSMAWLEDYVLGNMRVFAEAGIPAVKLQDQTRAPGAASPETIARTAALGRLIRSAHPGIALGIIVQAHDAEAPLAIAEAAGAAFVRLKVYVGASVSAEGVKEGLGVPARAYRERHARGVAIVADVHDRTSLPLGEVGQPQAAGWAEQMGADALVITGASIADTLRRIATLREARVRRPILIGGGVDAGNIEQALGAASGVIVSTALMADASTPHELLRWAPDKCARLMDAVRRLPG
jgi:hypothetical protein